MFLLAGLALPGRLVDGSLSKRPSQAQRRRTNWIHLPVGLLSAGRSMRCWCNAVWAVVNLVYRDMSSQWGKEPDLVWKLDSSWQEIFGLTSMHGVDSPRLGWILVSCCLWYLQAKCLESSSFRECTTVLGLTKIISVFNAGRTV